MKQKSSKKSNILYAAHIETPLGQMVGISDDDALLSLGFNDAPSGVIFQDTKPLLSIKNELALYFDGKLRSFATPLHITGTEFQKSAWEALLRIEYGKVISYKEQAAMIGNPRAARATGSANGANRFVVAIPCHRVVGSNGLGGYNAGLWRKEWLLAHERVVRS